MSRSGVEAKPRWASVPVAVRSRVGDVLGSPVVRAMRVFGGYSPTPTFRLRLADGRRAFLKAATPSSTAFAQVAHAREERVYRELGALIGPWAPSLLDSFEEGDWRVMLLEDLGPKSVPPWTAGLARGVARALGDFHRRLSGAPIPSWLPRPHEHPALGVEPPAWSFAAEDLDQLARLAGPRRGDARAWLVAHVPALSQAAAGVGDPARRHSLLHVDVRSDNLRWVHGRLLLFDWPHVAVGPPEFDAAAFAQTVGIEGGPDPETVMGWYGERWTVDRRALDSSVASIAGYFARHAWLPSIPQLPRVRAFQRAQLAVCLRWAARRLGLPDPTWVAAFESSAQPR